MEITRKLTSRKFWICVAAFLGSLATGINGQLNGDNTIVIIGTICAILSAAVYAACEAYVDGRMNDNNKEEEEN